MDVGNVRKWKRMRRRELMEMFNEGKKVKIKKEGKKMKGYEKEMEMIEKRKDGGGKIMMERK